MDTQANTQSLKASGLVARVLLCLIRLYQLTISRLMASRCRFSPSCSSYAMDAVREYGALRGAWMAMARVARCHPWNEGGWDPVQPRLPLRRSTDA